VLLFASYVRTRILLSYFATDLKAAKFYFGGVGALQFWWGKLMPRENRAILSVPNNSGHATWLAIFTEDDNAGVGPVDGVVVENIRAREEGQNNGILVGFNSSSMVSNVKLDHIYMLSNTTPAKTLEEMKILEMKNTANIAVA
jgi:hypothetical protein